jgi:hypothetical protein
MSKRFNLMSENACLTVCTLSLKKHLVHIVNLHDSQLPNSHQLPMCKQVVTYIDCRDNKSWSYLLLSVEMLISCRDGAEDVSVAMLCFASIVFGCFLDDDDSQFTYH